MAAGKYSTYIPYTPGSPPSAEIQLPGMIRAIWDEFYRLATSLIDIDRPVSLTLLSNEPLPAETTAGAWTRLFNGGEQSQWDQPGGSFNHATGEYNIAQEGLYQLYVRLNVPPFPSPQTKDYQAQIQFTINYIQAGKLDFVGIIESGGLDTFYLTCQGQILMPMSKGDIVTFDARLIRASGAVASIACTASLQTFRVSGVK